MIDPNPGRAIHWGARLLLLLAIVTWLILRYPLVSFFALRAHNDATKVLPSDLPFYYAMADTVLRHGRVAAYDPKEVLPLQALVTNTTDFRHLPQEANPTYKIFDYNDWGYSLVVAGSWLVPGAPHNLWIVLGVQLLVDALCLMLVCVIGLRMFSPYAGSAAALFYAVHPTLGSLAAFPYYYYWPVPAVIVALAIWTWVQRDSDQVPAWRAMAKVAALGLAIGAFTLVRSTTGTLAVAFGLALLLAMRIRLRTLLLLGCLAIACLLPLVPTAVVKYRLHGVIQFRAKEIFWHTILCGLGNHDNPWGLEWQDEVAFKRIRDKYGVAFTIDNSREYEAACHQEVRALWQENPSIFVRNFWRNLWWGLRFRSAIPADQDVPAVHKSLNQLRLLAALGWLVLLVAAWRRPDWRCNVLLLSMLVLMPVLQIAPICRPVYSYISSMFPVEALIGGCGLAVLGESLVARFGKTQGPPSCDEGPVEG